MIKIKTAQQNKRHKHQIHYHICSLYIAPVHKALLTARLPISLFTFLYLLSIQSLNILLYSLTDSVQKHTVWSIMYPPKPAQWWPSPHIILNSICFRSELEFISISMNPFTLVFSPSNSTAPSKVAFQSESSSTLYQSGFFFFISDE